MLRSSAVRIGTWNLDAKWSDRHRALIADERCDIWLLTELSRKAYEGRNRIADYHFHCSNGVMPRQQHWAAILSLELPTALPDPHTASAAALINDVTYCASILPWAGCETLPTAPWIGDSLSARARAAVGPMTAMLPKSSTVWGGDWNQNLFGGWEHVGSGGMRVVIESALESLELQLPTRKLLHRLSNCHTIDHIAVPTHWLVSEARRISADGLSDHDAYVIEVHRARSFRSKKL